jgi:hypothetical protein
MIIHGFVFEIYKTGSWASSASLPSHSSQNRIHLPGLKKATAT